ncbi:MAG: CBS domain-containing protein [Gammaproteobacteria bacterium]
MTYDSRSSTGMKRIPSIKTVMTPFPYSIDPGAAVDEALDVMRDHGIHHLPVTEEGNLAGMISSRDIQLMLAKRDGADVLKVRDVMSEDTYTVDLSERLDSVLHRMAEHHLRSVVVTRKGKLVGIFTQIDACGKFAEYLREQLRRSGGGTAA